MTDIFGEALSDFYTNQMTEPLWLYTNQDPEPEEMPLEVFFRQENDLTPLERTAVEQCRGKILDIGAGAGAISLILQQNGQRVQALELNSKACHIMRDMGVKSVINQNIWSGHQQYYDTLLLMMNGIGLCGHLEKLPLLLKKLRSMMEPDGQIIFDSSDISYLFIDNEPTTGKYFGEIEFNYRYKGQGGAPFWWLYIDIQRVLNITTKAGFDAELLAQSPQDEYLMRLTVTKSKVYF